MSHRYHSISISALILLCSNCLQPALRAWWKQVRPVKTSLVDISREPVLPVYTLDLLFICRNLHGQNPSAFTEKEFIPVTFLSNTCNYYNRLCLTVSTNFAISRFTGFIGSFAVSELSV